MSNIHYSPAAEDDLAGIKEYIAEELNSPIAATNTVAKITERIDYLELFPEIGAPLTSIIELVTDYRLLVCGNYLAFYRTDGDNVYIIRIIYGRRDYVKILFGESATEELE